MPPTKLSPPPVGSTDFVQRVGRADEKPVWAGQDGTVRSFLDDDMARTQLVDFCAGRRTRLSSLVSWCASLSFSTKPSTRPEQTHEVFERDVQPQVHRVGHDEFSAAPSVEHVMLQGRRNVGQSTWRFVCRRRAGCGVNFSNTPSSVKSGAAVVHVHLVFARPMKRLARRILQAPEVDPVLAVELKVSLREILAHDPDQVDRTEKARGHGRVTGRTAEQARIFAGGSFDGVQGGGADRSRRSCYLRFMICDLRLFNIARAGN